MVMVATIALIRGRQFGTKESLARPDLIGLFAHLLHSPMQVPQWESPILILFRCARLLESLAYKYKDQVTIVSMAPKEIMQCGCERRVIAQMEDVCCIDIVGRRLNAFLELVRPIPSGCPHWRA